MEALGTRVPFSFSMFFFDSLSFFFFFLGPRHVSLLSFFLLCAYVYLELVSRDDDAWPFLESLVTKELAYMHLFHSPAFSCLLLPFVCRLYFEAGEEETFSLFLWAGGKFISSLGKILFPGVCRVVPLVATR